MILKRLKNLIRNINYLSKHSLYDRREEDIVYLTQKILDDMLYEYDIASDKKSKLRILDKNNSVEQIVSSNKSFVRFGDGEINLLMGISQPFQKYEKEIGDRLFSLLKNPREDIYVCLNREYYLPNLCKNEVDREYLIRNAFDFRCFFEKNCNPENTYLDATCTFYYWDDFGEEADAFWSKWKEAFRDKKLVIVCGEGILDKLEYDVFEYAASKRFIYGPRRNAWDKHDELIASIREEADFDEYIIFIFGMAGKAMIPEVTDMGYIAWDIGHLAKSYNAYMTRMPGTKENIADFFAPD